VGLWWPKPNGWGALRLTTVGRRTGLERSVIVGYFEDGSNLVTMAMNGWGEGEPAWWLNLQAYPDAEVELCDGQHLVTGRGAHGEERERLWSRWQRSIRTSTPTPRAAHRRPPSSSWNRDRDVWRPWARVLAAASAQRHTPTTTKERCEALDNQRSESPSRL